MNGYDITIALHCGHRQRLNILCSTLISCILLQSNGPTLRVVKLLSALLIINGAIGMYYFFGDQDIDPTRIKLKSLNKMPPQARQYQATHDAAALPASPGEAA